MNQSNQVKSGHVLYIISHTAQLNLAIPPCIGSMSSTWVIEWRSCSADLGAGMSASCTAV